MSANRRIAYVMTRFPKITETFILGEMSALEQLGWEVFPFALVRERETIPHPAIAAFIHRVHFPFEHLWPLLKANGRAILLHPLRVMNLAFLTLWHCWRAPRMLLRSLISFPVAVLWAEEVRQRNVEHIHAQFATHATYIALMMSRLTGISFSFTAHAHDIYVDTTMLPFKMNEALFVVTISEFNRKLLTSLAPAATARVQVIPCGIDTSLFHPIAKNHQSGTLHIVCVARLQEYKGVLYLVEACNYLRTQGLDFRCNLVGDGPDRQQIEAAIARWDLGAHIKLLGWLPSPQVSALVASADVFVLPSVIARNGRMEGLPTVLMEALSCEVPVVSTAISGIPELVCHGVNGMLVEPRDPRGLADAIGTLARDAALRQQLGKQGRQDVLERFDLRTNTTRKALLFAQMTAGSS